MSELRWNPLLNQWVVTASDRQDRTYLPDDAHCPLCPTRPGGPKTEVPEGTYDIAVFENRFPTFSFEPPEPSVEGTRLTPTRPAIGASEIVLYSPDHDASLATEPVERVLKLVRVWTDRFRALGGADAVKYVFAFENKGEEAGVAISHPHGQIYAYPFVPPFVVRELESARAYDNQTGRCLWCDVLAEERRDGRRVVAENGSFVATVPFFARYPYEVHVTPRRHFQSLADLVEDERRDLAAMLKTVVVAYDGLFARSAPYVMAIHQRPTDGPTYDYFHFHVEFYPPMRSVDRPKFLAGSELGAGVYVNDTIPEHSAAELRSHVRPVEWRAEARSRG